MLAAIAGGSQMGPGEGWVHPGQSRESWPWLAARADADKDGSITRQEFPGADDGFERLDRNRDGVLTADDFDWSQRSAYARQAGLAAQWTGMIDGNSNGRISRDEWQAFFSRIAKDKNYLTPEDLRAAFHPPPPPRPAKEAAREGPSPLILLQGLLTGELGSFFEGPAIGQRAPEFALKTQDGSREVRLSQYRGHKPVVLVFGSFT
jgi:hypothetical protein